MQKALGILSVISIILSAIIASLIGEDITSSHGIGWVVGYGIGSVLIALILCGIPAGIYWLVKRKQMPKFMLAVCLTWGLIFFLASTGSLLSLKGF